MKIRKILPLVLLALIALFSLSSCDWLLDTIFQGNNTFNVYVSIAKGTHTDWATTGSVTVYLYDYGNNLVATMTQPTDAGIVDATYAYFYVSFTAVPKGAYYIAASYSGVLGATVYPSFTDPNYPSSYITLISLPDPNPSDSTGKTVTVTTFPF
jgi:hypothetical protein